MKIPGAHYQDASWQKIGYAVTQALTDAIISVGDQLCLNSLLADIESFSTAYPEIWAVAQQALRTRSYGSFKKEHNCHGHDGLMLAESLLEAIWAGALVGKLGADLCASKKKTAARIKSVCGDFLKDLRDELDADACSADPEIQAMFEAREAALPAGLRRKGSNIAISSDHLYRLRTVEQAMTEFRRFLENWRNHPEKVGTLLGIDVLPTVEPLAVRRALVGLRRGECKAAWLLDYHQKFAPRPKKLVQYEGPILCGQQLTEGKWALKSLEARVDGLIGELRDYASLCDALDNELPVVRDGDGDLLDLNNPEVIASVLHALLCEADDDTNRLQENPVQSDSSPDADPEAEDEDDDPVPQDEHDSDGNDLDWDIARGDNSIADSPGSSTVSEQDDEVLQAITASCIQAFPLAIQVAVLIEIFPKGDADLPWLLKNMNAFGRLGMNTPSLKALSPKFLAGQLAAAANAKPLSEQKFMAQVKLAQVKFLDCCKRRLIATREQ